MFELTKANEIVSSINENRVLDKIEDFNKAKKNFDVNKFLEYITISNNLNNKTDELSKKLNSFPKGEMGLTLDNVVKSDEFKKVKSEFNNYNNTLGDYNKSNKEFMKLYSKYFKYILTKDLVKYINKINNWKEVIWEK